MPMRDAGESGGLGVRLRAVLINSGSVAVTATRRARDRESRRDPEESRALAAIRVRNGVIEKHPAVLRGAFSRVWRRSRGRQ